MNYRFRRRRLWLPLADPQTFRIARKKTLCRVEISVARAKRLYRSTMFVWGGGGCVGGEDNRIRYGRRGLWRPADDNIIKTFSRLPEHPGGLCPPSGHGRNIYFRTKRKPFRIYNVPGTYDDERRPFSSGDVTALMVDRDNRDREPRTK